MAPVVDPPRLFVYGTLMPGRLRWSVLAPFARAHRPAAAPGTLYDSGRGWPVAVFDPAPAPDAPGSEGVVPGVVVDLHPHRAAEALALLDEVEGIATDLLRRVAVVTVDGWVAWAYHHHRAVVGLEPIADWSAVPRASEA